MKKAIKILIHLTLTLAFVAYIAYQFRTDPIGRMAGKAVTGMEVAYPKNWDFTSEHRLMAVEVRPSAPHSVTTVSFIYEGDLHIPALNGAGKNWTAYAMADPRARLKIGGKVYPVKLTRVPESDIAAMAQSLSEKYHWMLADGSDRPLPSTWFFRVTER
ncbi:MAG: hypothetical protein ACR2PJ_00390 [Pseudomonadales bacterium]